MAPIKYKPVVQKEERSLVRGQRVRFECTKCSDSTDAPLGTERDQTRVCRRCYGKAEDHRPRELNDLTGSEWARASKSVEQYPDTRSDKQRLHGASFPESLARRQIEIYTKANELVLDPFVGVGTTIDACASLRRRGIGVDISPDFIDLARNDLSNHPNGADQRLVVGDAQHLDEFVDSESVDFVLTSPPYGPLLKKTNAAFAYKWQEHSTINSIPNPQPYTDSEDDLGNMEYPDFLGAISRVLTQTLKALKHNTYAVWVVKDFRATKAAVPYVNFHGHFIDRATEAGFTLWDLRVYDQTKHRPLVCLGYPSRNFYLNIGHSFLVVLKKQ